MIQANGVKSNALVRPFTTVIVIVISSGSGSNLSGANMTCLCVKENRNHKIIYGNALDEHDS